jgi:hypothetical protein
MKLLIIQFSLPPYYSSLLVPNFLLTTIFSNALGLCFPLLSDTEFHINTKQREKCSFVYCHVCPGNVTNKSWNVCLTLGFIWPFFGRATTIHFTDL